jgi:hypothetical protein
LRAAPRFATDRNPAAPSSSARRSGSAMHPSLSGRASSFHLLVGFGFALASTACGSSADTPEDGGTSTTSDAGTDGGGQADGDTASDGSSLPQGVLAIPLQACQPLTYSADLAIGSQTFRLLVDTGSTSLGVAGAGCSNCQVSPAYMPGASAKDQGQTANSQFGSGQFSGEIYQDQVAFASAPTVPMKFVSITSQMGFFQGGFCGGKKYEGIVGFDRASAAIMGTNALFDQMISVQKVHDVFATQLCDDGGTLWLGGFDPAALAGAPQYTPFTKSLYSGYYYTVNLATIAVGTNTVPIASGATTDAVVDTGTSVWVLADTAFNQLTAAIGAAPGFQQVLGANASSWFTVSNMGVACANLTQTKAELDSTLPKLSMTFGSNPGITVDAVATESYLMPNPTPGGGWCNALIPASVALPGQMFPFASIMGAPVLRSNVVIFDRTKGQVGFAPHKPCTTSQRSAAAVPAAAPVRVPQRIPQLRTN